MTLLFIKKTVIPNPTFIATFIPWGLAHLFLVGMMVMNIKSIIICHRHKRRLINFSTTIPVHNWPIYPTVTSLFIVSSIRRWVSIQVISIILSVIKVKLVNQWLLITLSSFSLNNISIFTHYYFKFISSLLTYTLNMFKESLCVFLSVFYLVIN